MRVDLFGSRFSLIPLMRNMKQIGYDINKAYLGSAISSQYAKTQRVDHRQIKKKLIQYEELEVLNDRLKLFRRFSKNTNSSWIVVDFLYEGNDILTASTGRLTSTPANIKYDRSITKYKVLNKDVRVDQIEDNIKAFIHDLKNYDKIILNRLRYPKYEINSSGEKVLKNNINQINFMNSIIESYEDLLLSKINTVKVIPI